MSHTHKEYDVIIIGGGITGAGVARDCALRGLSTLLIEREDISRGATGRNHGLLHSGGRYAVKDRESARECISENKIIRKIAPHCVEQTGGLFITLPEDEESGYGLMYQDKFIDCCESAGIETRRITPAKALSMEPSVNPALVGAVVVPDCSVDPFKLCVSNILDAKLHGAEILTYHKVTGIIKAVNTVIGVQAQDMSSGEIKEFYGNVTINAAGIWGQAIAAMAGININMYPAKGTLLVFAHRVNKMVINRCRKSADGDILVPCHTVSIIGTTSTKIAFEECDSVTPSADEVALMLREGCNLAPSLASTRILRAYAGVRPLVAADDDPSGRSISRGIVCMDHATRDAVEGFVTITGGKLTDYRLMAQMATDTACSKLGISTECETAERPMAGQSGLWTGADLVCECENVAAAEIRQAVASSDCRSIEDVRRRTRLGMGTCQGTVCIRRAAEMLSAMTDVSSDRLIVDFVRERWKGMTSVGWGDTLREMELMQKVYKKDITL